MFTLLIFEAKPALLDMSANGIRNMGKESIRRRLEGKSQTTFFLIRNQIEVIN